jgi:hypothetical protein
VLPGALKLVRLVQLVLGLERLERLVLLMRLLLREQMLLLTGWAAAERITRRGTRWSSGGWVIA